MADFKGTPGPWHLIWGGQYVLCAEDKHKSIGGATDPDEDKKLFACPICEIRAIDTGYAHRRSRTEAEANARLIAAAPRLLAALERILGLQEEHDGEPFEAVVEHAETIARDVIAKAKGG